MKKYLIAASAIVISIVLIALLVNTKNNYTAVNKNATYIKPVIIIDAGHPELPNTIH